MERDAGQRRWPAFAASALAHAALLFGALLALRHAPKLPVTGEATPVTVVASAPEAGPVAPAAAPAASAPAPEPTPPEPPAAVEPEPAPPPPPPPPRSQPRPEPRSQPRPAPAPPRPAPAPRPTPVPRPLPPPKPTPRPAPPKPAPPPPEPAPPRPRPVAKPAPRPELNLKDLASSLPGAKPARKPQDLDLGALASSLPARAQHRHEDLDLASVASSLGPAHPATAPTRGPPRPAQIAGEGLTGGEKAALRAKLIRLWNLNCSVPGADKVVVRARMRLAPSGALAAPPQVVGTSGDAPSEVKAAAVTRALSAISRGAPYLEVSPEHLKTMNDFVFTFDAKTACQG